MEKNNYSNFIINISINFYFTILRYYKKTHPEITGTKAIDNE